VTIRILFTGENSFIGGNIFDQIVKGNIFDEDLEIISIVRRISEGKAPGLEVTSGVRVMRYVSSIEESAHVISNDFDYVMHFAAEVDFYGKKEIIEKNLEPIRTILGNLDSFKGTFIFASTLGVLDRSNLDSCDVPLDEDSKKFPTSNYGVSKLEGEKLISELLPNNSLIIRIPWAYGENMSKSHHLARLFETVRRRGLVGYIDWPGQISLISIENFARAFTNLLSSGTLGVVHVYDEHMTFGNIFSDFKKSIGGNTTQYKVPRIFLRVAHKLRGFLPFELRCLLFDSMLSHSVLETSWKKDFRKRSTLLGNSISIKDHKLSAPIRTVIITGGGRGLGASIARNFLRYNHRVVIADAVTNPDPFQRSLQFPHHLSRENLSEFCIFLKNEGLIPTTLINNAGVATSGDFSQLTYRDIESMIEVNFSLPLLLTKVIDQMYEESPLGIEVVNISSSSAFQQIPKYATYGATKNAMSYWSEVINSESRKIQTLTVYPGGMATKFKETKEKQLQIGLLNPEKVGRVIFENYILGTTGRLVIGIRAKIFQLLEHTIPRSIQRKVWGRLENRI